MTKRKKKKETKVAGAYLTPILGGPKGHNKLYWEERNKRERDKEMRRLFSANFKNSA